MMAQLSSLFRSHCTQMAACLPASHVGPAGASYYGKGSDPARAVSRTRKPNKFCFIFFLFDYYYCFSYFLLYRYSSWTRYGSVSIQFFLFLSSRSQHLL